MKSFFFLLAISFSSKIEAQVQWQPTQIQRVPEIVDCSIGDIAIARSYPSPHIRFCPQVAAETNQMFPGAGHFYYVHEYGHILVSPNEAEADRFAASQLAILQGSYYYINAMLSQLYYRAKSGERATPGYGTPLQRANRILQAAIAANPNLSVNVNGFLE